MFRIAMSVIAVAVFAAIVLLKDGASITTTPSGFQPPPSDEPKGLQIPSN